MKYILLLGVLLFAMLAIGAFGEMPLLIRIGGVGLLIWFICILIYIILMFEKS